MNADLSAAPELAQLARPLLPARQSRTDGHVAADLADLAADPQRWWDLVRFDPAGPVRIPVPGAPATWLLVLPPGSAAGCDCRQATAIAGEAAETCGTAGADRRLRPGRVLLHGTRARHRLRAAGHGYSVTLHWKAATVRSG